MTYQCLSDDLNCNKRCLLANDTLVLTSDKTRNIAHNKAEKELLKPQEWFLINKIHLERLSRYYYNKTNTRIRNEYGISINCLQ